MYSWFLLAATLYFAATFAAVALRSTRNGFVIALVVLALLFAVAGASSATLQAILTGIAEFQHP
jgi:hypothetical protein